MPRLFVETYCEESGQMTVELAALIPVVLVIAMTVLNLARFIEACALFDRVCLDAVISQGVSPAGVQSTESATTQVRSEIEHTLAFENCDVEVVAADVSAPASSGHGVSLPVSPLLTTFTCTLLYHPWPGSFTIAGCRYESPLALRHERSITVDRFRPGVVM